MKTTFVRSAALATLLGCLAGLLAGCGSARRGEPIAGPMPLESESLVRGAQLFDRYCTACHPGGEAGLGPAINNKPLPGFMIRFQVRHGIGAMPAFRQEVIGDAEIKDLVHYVKALRHHHR